jgi:RHS repeat-associated protein
LAIYDANDNILMRFTYADSRLPVTMQSGGNTYYLAYDQVGSLRIVTDATGTVIKALDYDSFGNIIQDTNPSFDMPFGFAGGLYDPDTGLVRFGFREYSSEIGRWTAKDPILFRGGDSDLYGYCLSDPINLIDPYGQWAGIDDLVFSLGGALVGLGGQLAADVISGQWSGWEDYVGAGLGGAAGGEALLYTGPIGAGAVGGAVSNLTKQGGRHRGRP